MEKLEKDGIRLTLQESNELNVKIVKQQEKITELLRWMFIVGGFIFILFVFGLMYALWFIKTYHVLGYVGYAIG